MKVSAIDSYWQQQRCKFFRQPVKWSFNKSASKLFHNHGIAPRQLQR